MWQPDSIERERLGSHLRPPMGQAYLTPNLGDLLPQQHSGQRPSVEGEGGRNPVEHVPHSDRTSLPLVGSLMPVGTGR